LPVSDQRSAVYKLRRRVLGADVAATKEMVLDLVEDTIIAMVGRACPERSRADTWDVGGLTEISNEQFGLPITFEAMGDVTREALENIIYAAVEKMILEREENFTPEAFYHVGRIIYLQTIDALWKEHLREMDQLREGISLRGYAQKDPKQEYKKEGYNLFASMMGTIGADVLQKVSRVVITRETEEDYQARLQAQREKQERLMRAEATKLPAPAPAPTPAPAAAPAAVAARPAEPPKQETVRRDVAKVGPNEMCPCGSGLKYKKCHMLKDAAHA
jgi:preprotein translocase subunit SecA